MSRAFVAACIALLAGSGAYVAALAWLPASYVNRHYVPVGNDSFYHARRILDAIADPSAFYEFDPHIHAPEGSWITWPWAYDEGLAFLVRGLQQLSGAHDPMSILVFIPPTWAFVNAALLIAVGAVLGLAWPGLLLAGAAFAFSSLTQMLHGVGMIDHHYVEYTFVLATLLAGLLWFRDPARRAPAAWTGVVLGIAPAFHNGLFSLQVPVDFALLALWLRGEAPPWRATLAFICGLLVATLAAVLPSDPFRDGQFSMTTLSWFHLYVAALGAGGAGFLSMRPHTRANFALLSALGVAALVPAAREIATGAHFLGASLVKLDDVSEALNLWRQLQVFGLHGVLVTYSGWIFVVPLAALACTVALARRDTSPRWRFASVFALFGVALMCFQARLHYFGSAVMFLFPPLALQHAWKHLPSRQALALGGLTVAGLVAGYVPVWKELWISPPPAWDYDEPYDVLDRTLFPKLRAACAAQPGIVLADNNDGHLVRFNTDCSVIANNFILTPLHERKLLEMQRLMALPAADLTAQAPYVDYVFVHRGRRRTGGLRAELLSGNGPFAPGFELVAEVTTPDGTAAARVFRIVHPAAAPPAQ